MEHRKRLLAAVFAAGMLWQPLGELPAETAAAEDDERYHTNQWDKDFFWKLDESTGAMQIYGKGAMPEPQIWEYEAPWHEVRDQIKTVVLEDGITTLGYTAFYCCENLTSIELPDSITEIREQALCGCSSLKEIRIPDNVKTIGYNAFSDCSSLTSIVIPDGITVIPAGLLSDCTNLTSVLIPDSVSKIERAAFKNCPRLTEIDIPSDVTFIGGEVFMDCTGLTEIQLPQGIEVLSDYLLYGCTGLTSVVIPEHVKDAEECALAGCANLTSVVIPKSLTYLGEAMFSGCGSLQSFVIPDHITKIGYMAFTGCEGLKSVMIPDSVNMIERFAFDACTMLPSIIIPASVEHIERGAFRDCEKLASVVILNPDCDVQTEYNEFMPFPDLTHIYGFAGSTAEAYAKARANDFYRYLRGDINCDGVADEADIKLLRAYKGDGWTEHSRINGDINYDGSIDMTDTEWMEFYLENDYFQDETPPVTTKKTTTTTTTTATTTTVTATTAATAVTEPTDGECGENLTWFYDISSGVLVIEGEGDMQSAPWGKYKDKITAVELPEGLRSICKGAFADCVHLPELLIPSGVVSVDETAFVGCDDLEVITVSEGNEYYCSDAGVLYTADQTALVYYPAAKPEDYEILLSVTTILPHAFDSFHGRKDIAVSEYVEKICADAFQTKDDFTDIWIFNPDCEIEGKEQTINPKTVIHSFTNSTAHTYADQYKRTFKAFDLRGDADCDGEVTGDDVDFIMDWDDDVELTAQGRNNADVNKDGNIDEDDAAWVLYYLEQGYYPDEKPETTTETTATTTTTTTTTTTSATAKPTTTTTAMTTRVTTPKPATTTTTTTTAVTTTTSETVTTVTTLLTTTTQATETTINPYSGTCGSNLTWKLNPDNGTLTISGKGAMKNFNKAEEQPWHNVNAEIASLRIEKGITSIGSYAFDSCSELEKIILPNTVTSIGSYAFSKCTSLPIATIPYAVTSIGSLAFGECSVMTEIVILNPKCVIPDSKDTIPALADIYAPAGSTAATYANKYKRAFKTVRFGDGTFDGKVSILDARIALLLYTESVGDKQIELYSEPELDRLAKIQLDIDGNGQVTVEDAQYIMLYYMAGLVGYPQNWNELLNQ